MAALVAGVSDADFSGRDFIGETKKTAVGTAVGAETFRSQKIDGHKSADEEKRNGDRDGRESFPKICGYQMIGKLRNKRFVLRRGEKSICGGINEHIQRGEKRHEDQQPRAKRLRRESEFF